MTVLDLIALLRRQWLPIGSIVLAVLIAAGVLSQLQTPSTRVTLLYTTSVTQSVSTTDYDATKLADDMARTIAGWLQSPHIATQISERAEVAVGASAAPQARQNILLTLTLPTTADAETAIAATTDALRAELDRYNQASAFNYAIILHGQAIDTNKTSLPTVLVAAAVSGILLAVAWVVLVSYMSGRISTVREAEELLGVAAANGFARPDDRAAFFIESAQHAKQIAIADSSAKSLRDALDITQEIHQLPADAAKLQANTPLLLIVRLDHSTRSTLRQLRSQHSGDITLAIWGSSL